MPDMRLAWLRVQLFTAIQQLHGDDLADFWRLIGDVQACRPVSDGWAEAVAMVNVPAEAVETAIAAAKRAVLLRTRSTEWTTLTLHTVDLVAKLSVEAAAPHIAAAGREELAERIRSLLTSGPIGQVTGERYVRAGLIRAELDGPQ